jgi:hypothetical protein
MTKHEFKAYGPKGDLKDYTWTSSPGTYAAECAAYQARLDRCELFWVDVWSSDPHEEYRRMRPQEKRS